MSGFAPIPPLPISGGGTAATTAAAALTNLGAQAQVLLGAVTTTQTTTSQATLQDATAGRVTLSAGVWWIDSLQLQGDAVFAVAGCQSGIRFSGTASTACSSVFRGSSADAEPVNQTGTYAGVPGGSYSSNDFFDTIDFAATSPVVRRFCKLTVTVAGDLILQFAQSTSNASTNNLYKGSRILATKIG